MKFEYYNTHHSGTHNIQVMCDLFAFISFALAAGAALLLDSEKFSEIALTVLIGCVLLFTILLALKGVLKSLALGNFYTFTQVYPEHLEAFTPVEEEERTE